MSPSRLAVPRLATAPLTAAENAAEGISGQPYSIRIRRPEMAHLLRAQIDLIVLRSEFGLEIASALENALALIQRIREAEP